MIYLFGFFLQDNDFFTFIKNVILKPESKGNRESSHIYLFIFYLYKMTKL